MCLQPLEGVGMGEEDAKPTVALSLAGTSGLPVLIIAGEKKGGGSGGGSGGGAAMNTEEREKELELMALPRSDEQKSEDAQVTVRVKKIRPVPPMWRSTVVHCLCTHRGRSRAVVLPPFVRSTHLGAARRHQLRPLSSAPVMHTLLIHSGDLKEVHPLRRPCSPPH